MTSRLRHLFSGKFPLATVVYRRVVATPRVGYPDDMTLDKHVLKIGWFANYELHRISAIPPDSYLALLSAAFCSVRLGGCHCTRLSVIHKLHKVQTSPPCLVLKA